MSILLCAQPRRVVACSRAPLCTATPMHCTGSQDRARRLMERGKRHAWAQWHAVTRLAQYAILAAASIPGKNALTAQHSAPTNIARCVAIHSAARGLTLATVPSKERGRETVLLASRTGTEGRGRWCRCLWWTTIHPPAKCYA